MKSLALGLMALQALVLIVDEVKFHRRRVVPRWERVGHPIDTASVLGCYLVALCLAPSRGALTGYALLAAFSCLLVTKDEFMHARHCEPAEHWLHALLFVLHPLVLMAIAVLWFAGARWLLAAQATLTGAFGAYQVVYWNLIAPPALANERSALEQANQRAARPSMEKV